MSFPAFLDERFGRCVRQLALSACAQRVLHMLAVRDLEPETATRRDRHGRQGVTGWDELLDQLMSLGFSDRQIEESVDELANWRVAQVVGRDPGDPVVAGPAAIRLTPEGRACIGLAPGSPVADDLPDREPGGWTVFHGVSREQLMSEAVEIVGDRGWRPLVALGGGDALIRMTGEVTRRLCSDGFIVVDAFQLSDAERLDLLPQLIWRTQRARGVRILILPDPTPVRPIAVLADVDLKWIETFSDGEHEEIGIDLGVSRKLLEKRRAIGKGWSLADMCGVPGGGIALPKRTKTTFAEMIVPDKVRTQLEQVQMHAHFRLQVLPSRRGYVGGGGGYRLLLSGLPGTGKSMCAEALANSLGRSVVKLDLSAVLSKWLGETEQLIGKVFDMAEASESVLVLDEAESLFRQRQSGAQGSSALSTAVAYLLTRLERYKGVLVATTNRTQDVDEAFFRRFNDYIVLPTPDAPTRLILWNRMLPCGEPEWQPDGIDVELLADRFAISGGLIRGAAIRANAWANGMGKPLDMPLVLAALGRELEKSDRSANEVFVEPYSREVADLLRHDDFLGAD